MDNPWIEIRNGSNHLLFRYNPFTNEIEFRKGGYVYDLIRLDEIRIKFGTITTVEMKPVSEIITVDGKKVPE